MPSVHYHGRKWIHKPDSRFLMTTTAAGCTVFDVKPGAPAHVEAAAEPAGKKQGGKGASGGKGGQKGGKGAKGGKKGGKGKKGGAASGAGSSGPPNTRKRDRLQEIAKKWQQKWAEDKMYEVDAPADAASGSPAGKFMVTFPYPYMNGRLHLGHAFTITKAEFAARFQRLLGKDVLFPFGFHCTGMPIQAAANKLKRELALGAEGASEAAAAAAASKQAASGEAQPQLPGQFRTKRSKAVAKTGGAKTQGDILRMLHVPEEEIPRFADPMHWLRYFPPLGKADLQAFGVAVDWRRSFITTDVNPYYDSFVRWQFHHLKEGGFVRYGTRPTIYSQLDGQACADHDRSEGEGVQPQEYTLIKLRVVRDAEGQLPAPLRIIDEASGGRKREVVLVAATLRPETMYGQTNCFLLPSGEYGAFESGASEDGEVFVCSQRSAQNMAYQGLSPARGETKCLGTFSGMELMGLPLKAPRATYERVYTLPLLTISMGKGTGVVTSVPSDAPDDFAALRDLQQDAEERAKYGLTEEMVNFDVVEIIDIPGLGRRAAVTLCEYYGVKTQHDKKGLVQAKAEAYKKGFYDGVMCVGPHAGKKVEDAKALVKAEMIEAGEAAPYWEPTEKVVSRSGDECIVAQLDQWYLDYGEDEWRARVEKHVKSDNFTAHSKQAMAQFDNVIGWLKGWACSRSFGLGTKLPWDEQFVIESLSDSTVYMSYYAVAHLLQEGALDGSKQGPIGIDAKDMTPAAWDYVYLGAGYPEGCAVEQAKLDRLKAEFKYWYPLDLRVSGKDLINNHLTMSLYNHAAIWKDDPGMMPRGFFTNGHVKVDSMKMSKSTGNFLSLTEAMELYSVDGVRFALASSGDTIEDANFEQKEADAAILRLNKEEEFIQQLIKDEKEGNLRTGAPPAGAATGGASSGAGSGGAGDGGDPMYGPLGDSFPDRAFECGIAECMNRAKVEYGQMHFREAMTAGFHGLIKARDFYRDFCIKLGQPMHGKVLRKFAQCLCIALAPVCPHWTEEMWELLGSPGAASVTRARWPDMVVPDPHAERSAKWLDYQLKSMRDKLQRDVAKRARNEKKKASEIPTPTGAVVYCATSYSDWQRAGLAILREQLDDDGTLPKAAMKQVSMAVGKDPELRKMSKQLMNFLGGVARRAAEDGPSALDDEPSQNDLEVFTANSQFVAQSLDCFAEGVADKGEAHIRYLDATKPRNTAEEADAGRALPGNPVLVAAWD